MLSGLCLVGAGSLEGDAGATSEPPGSYINVKQISPFFLNKIRLKDKPNKLEGAFQLMSF